MNRGMAPGPSARMALAAISCAIIVLPFQPALSQVVLSEIMFDPSGSENTDEFVELFNAGPADTVDLRGWRLGDGTGDDGLADAGGGFSLIPGQYAVVLDPDYFGQSASYDSLIPSGAIVLTVDGNTFGSGGLSNTRAETVVIFDAAGKVIEQCAYQTGIRPGYSFERVDPYVSVEPEDNWVESKSALGTPGFRNSAAKVQRNLEIVRIFTVESFPGTLLNAVVFNSGKTAVCDFEVLFTDDADNGAFPDEPEEIGRAGHDENLLPGDSAVIFLYHDQSPGAHRICARVVLSGDQSPEDDTLCRSACFGYPRNSLIINEIMFNPVSGESEWIEIFNPHSADISLVDWSVSDQDSTRKAGASISSGRIQAGGFYIFAGDSCLYRIFPGLSGRYQALPGFPILNNDSDSVVLYDPSGKRIDGVNYSSRWGGRKGISLERIDWHRESDHANNWHASISTQGYTPCEYNSLAPIDPADERYLAVQPNPFSAEADGSGQVAAISCHLPFESSYIHLRVFDSRGRAVRHLERGGICGRIAIYAWDGRDDLYRPMPVGQYIVFLEASEQNGGRTVIGRSVVVLARKL